MNRSREGPFVSRRHCPGVAHVVMPTGMRMHRVRFRVYDILIAEEAAGIAPFLTE